MAVAGSLRNFPAATCLVVSSETMVDFVNSNRSHWPVVLSPRNRAGRFAVNLSWLFNLRWVAIIGQFLTIAVVVYVFKVSVMIWPLAVILAVTTVSNLLLWAWFQYWHPVFQPEGWPNQLTTTDPAQMESFERQEKASGILVLGLVMTLDMLSLTSLLYTTGGPNNPFNFFFFVNLSLSAVVLTRRWSWGLNFLSIICFAFLIYDHVTIPELSGLMESVRVTERLSIPQAGTLVAFATCSSVIVYFMTRLTDELRLQERELRLAEVRQAQSEKLEALGTLAAGAAHELATPLSTIAIVARDVESQVEQLAPKSEIAEDVRLIRSELDRCRNILDQMSADAGLATGEYFAVVAVDRFLDDVLAGLPIITGLPNDSTVKVEIDSEVKQRLLRVPQAALGKAIRGLIKNAVDASRDPLGTNRKQNHSGTVNAADRQLAKRVEIDVCERMEKLCIEIRDFGVGMSPEILRRISEPFFTTKPVGQGMGLGVFLALSIVTRLDGQISFESQPGEGTTARIMLGLEGEANG